MNRLYSHHYTLLSGHRLTDIEFVAKVFGLRIEEI
jgi:hypothetical protein